MSEQAVTTDQTLDALGMSDEEFAQLDPSTFESELDTANDPETAPVDEDATEDPEAEDAAAAAPAEADEDDGTTDTADAAEEEDADPEDADEATTETDPHADDADTDTVDDAADDEESAEDDEDTSTDDEVDEDIDDVDYKAEYQRLLAPFKANGREMRVNNVDEAIQLMQMGANYNKKMAALKPSLKTLKLLEKHALLDEQKLGHLIDLSKGDQGAIQKLLKDSNIDPMDLGGAENSDYRPGTYTVDDREVELDAVLEDIKDTDTYQETISIVSNKWDDKSRQFIANNPQALKALNDQMAIGIFQRVSAEVERQRALGGLIGLSDLEAYRAIGDQLHQQGKFSDLVQTAPDTAPAKRKVDRKPKASKDKQVKQRKRAASPTRQKPASSTPARDYNPLALSDEDFEKEFAAKFL